MVGRCKYGPKFLRELDARVEKAPDGGRAGKKLYRCSQQAEWVGILPTP